MVFTMRIQEWEELLDASKDKLIEHIKADVGEDASQDVIKDKLNDYLTEMSGWTSQAAQPHDFAVMLIDYTRMKIRQ